MSDTIPKPPPAGPLLAWYDRHRRTLPWRGEADPYRIWLSEVMLQQTTVAAVGPRYARFLARFPDAGALAAAPWEDVAAEWAGLGYYARARNLHAAAKAVATRGGFPDTEAGLRELPGIGAYTAAAVAAIAFNRPTVPVDGNVERVVARLLAIREPLPGARRLIGPIAARFMEQPEPRTRPGDFVQALFDLGATICTPRRPACALCPWREDCLARREGIQESLPVKAPKAARTHRHGLHFLARDPAGRLLLRHRPPEGLLGGMLEIPGSPWREGAPWSLDEALPHTPLPGLTWTLRPGTAWHGFTHMELEMRLAEAPAPEAPAPEGMVWMEPDAARLALPTAIRRLLALAEGPLAECAGSMASRGPGARGARRKGIPS
ncbi:A/G-specific adenine glycosylase [Roseomonas xinghualingensis]|uniref:A/G-specific adenine glycosylase n=1 Tax=Roseomonas xinghualingensis TaxID=2986475 RepID=UPI0021F229EC|nr:A/G-specific adenine glycosylase [Roseomonas sp. SXEYE001]MCV4208721.1 A/G-specific adenine glycosylase [Roseomonas sp. SXEYE001]